MFNKTILSLMAYVAYAITFVHAAIPHHHHIDGQIRFHSHYSEHQSSSHAHGKDDSDHNNETHQHVIGAENISLNLSQKNFQFKSHQSGSFFLLTIDGTNILENSSLFTSDYARDANFKRCQIVSPSAVGLRAPPFCNI
ncbi:MAG: DUF6769 family protein [Arcticibacter sp.]